MFPSLCDPPLLGRKRAVVLDSYLPPDHPLYNPDLTQYSYDPETASADLEAFGWKLASDGLRYSSGIFRIFDDTPLSLTYYTSTNRIHTAASQLIVEMLAECGVDAQVTALSTDEYFQYGDDAPLFGRDFDLAQYAWQVAVEPPCFLYLSEGIPGDPLYYIGETEFLHELKPEVGFYDERSFPYGWGGANLTGFSNLDFDQACRVAAETLPGQRDFLENHHNTQAIFAEQLPVVPLYQRLKLVLARPDMCGFELDPSAFSEMWNIEGFDFGQACP